MLHKNTIYKSNNFKKTRKKRGDFILEEDLDEEIVDEEIVEEENADKNEPVYDESGEKIIEWKNKEYDDLWKKMPEQLKNLLMGDIEWLQDFMNKCVKSRKSGTSCNLFLPKQTLFPPHILENGKYDFESEIINNPYDELKLDSGNYLKKYLKYKKKYLELKKLYN